MYIFVWLCIAVTLPLKQQRTLRCPVKKDFWPTVGFWIRPGVWAPGRVHM